MKVVAFNGSARKDGNTTKLVEYVFEELEKEGIDTELVQLAGKHPHGCIACYQCFTKKNNRCAVEIDCINDCIEKMEAADGIILASPTYFADLSTELKALIDRTGMVSRANGDMYRRKVGAAVVARRRGGAIHVFDSINHFFTIGQMIIVGSSYWNIGVGREKGEVSEDAEGVETMRTLGKNMAWLLKKIKKTHP
ncbi:MAG TPA: flavodoxin family protein [Desulfobulbus sp.]|nr:flavodoxin family protein [Desulfobulbus sp.]